jgi:hypothetical protein
VALITLIRGKQSLCNEGHLDEYTKRVPDNVDRLTRNEAPYNPVAIRVEEVRHVTTLFASLPAGTT